MAGDSFKAIPITIIFLLFCIYYVSISRLADSRPLGLDSASQINESHVYIWPLPSEVHSANGTLTVDPDLSLSVTGDGGGSTIVQEAFQRYKSLIFKHNSWFSKFPFSGRTLYDITTLRIIVNSDDETLQLGVDESYTLLVAEKNDHSIIGEATIEANTVYGALRGLETFSQLCSYDYGSKTVIVYKAPWYIRDKPRFPYRGLMLDTSRHYYPVDTIKQIIQSMSYAKLNVFHWHIVDEESFPLEVPTYPNLWKGAYTKWERYTIEDAYEIVNYAKMRGINVLAEIDVPGHAESWGIGYPDLWPSPSCREPLDVSKNYTFDLISGILADLRKIFPFELFHLGGDEVNTDCWNSTPHIKQWLEDHNMTSKDAYQYFVLRAQEIAISHNWTPINWEETFNAFATKLNPKTIVHNWLGGGVCAKAVAKGFRCIFSNQGFWYLDHLDVQWDGVYNAEPLEGIDDLAQQNLVIGGQVCMWGETADSSNVQQTIWPRAAAAAERMWSGREAISTKNVNLTALPRLQYFRCLLTRRGVQAAPVNNFYARSPPTGPGSCYDQ
ncbi:beta-hexosaminidase 1 [Impatiens glandulifera]|uniref:beta-hexosaminidase 1 n=1 Tax=Impatiens glandulifera TaxID=253017 RepID=UPI001FB18A07|nr:beta-hexosaminidase 1 [Impatiens glandulifera]